MRGSPEPTALTALARGHAETQQAIAAAGAVPPLVKMLKAEGKHAAPGEGAADLQALGRVAHLAERALHQLDEDDASRQRFKVEACDDIELGAFDAAFSED
mgnify:CR=1 FL=1